jgi:hypothetical protein
LTQPGKLLSQRVSPQAFAADSSVTSSFSRWASAWVSFCSTLKEAVQLRPSIEDPLANLRTPQQPSLSISPKRGRGVGYVDRVQAQIPDRLPFRQQLWAWLRWFTWQYWSQKLEGARTSRELNIPVHVTAPSTGRWRKHRRLLNMRSGLATCPAEPSSLTHSDIDYPSNRIEPSGLPEGVTRCFCRVLRCAIVRTDAAPRCVVSVLAPLQYD